MQSTQTNLSVLERWIWYLALLLLGVTAFYLVSEIIMHLWIAQPLNFYEPEIAMDAYRLSEGLSIYPDFETGPFGGLYAPLYQLVSSLFFVIGWQNLQALRLISILSIFIAGWLIWRTTNPGKRARWSTLIPILLLLVWHNAVVQFDFHGKPDAFATLWLIVSLYFLVDVDGIRSDLHSLIYSMAALTLAFATKQTMLFAIPPILLTLLIHKGWKRAFQAGGIFLGFNIMLWPLLWWLTGPEMWFYVFKQAGIFPYAWGNLFRAVYSVLTQPLLLTAIAALVWTLYRSTWNAKLTLLTLTLMFAIPAGVITAIKSGGASNAHMATFWICSFILWQTLPLDQWLQRVRGIQTNSQSALQRQSYFGLSFLALLLFLQIGIKPYAWLKSFEYRLNGDQQYKQLAEQIRDLDGRVYCPWDNFLTLKAGNPLVWSQKWEMETGLHGITSETTYRDIIDSSRYVISVNAGHKRATDIDQLLEQYRFTRLKAFAIGQSLTYHLWEAPSPHTGSKKTDR